MMKQLLMGLVLALAIPMAATAADYKIGVVNLERLLNDSAPAARANKKLEKEFAARDQAIQRMAKQFRDMQAHLERETVTMSDADRRNKERELANMSRDLQRTQREFREDLNARQNEERLAFQDRVNKAINEMAEREKFDLILHEGIYYSPRVDITDKVLRILADK